VIPEALEDVAILSFALAHCEMGPRALAEHFGVPVERVHDILRRDLDEVVRQAR
jgi:hypothetical protein